MNTQKLHKCLTRALKKLLCRDEPLTRCLARTYEDCLREVEVEDFPEYLRDDFTRMKMKLEWICERVLSTDGSQPLINIRDDEARLLAEEFVRLYGEVQTHRAPYDPTSWFLNQQAEVETDPDQEWTQVWMGS